MAINKDFWNKRKVLITGHTGFKGSWLCMLLNQLGSEIYGYALDPPTTPCLFDVSGIGKYIHSHIEDIRNYDRLSGFIQEVKPDIVIHMAAQALVRESYKNPRATYEINTMGTVNLLDAARQVDSIKAILNVTSDKCYENKEWVWGYRENESLGGYDPYSNSKACSELVTTAYRNSFFNLSNYKEHGVALASARAGNVIGGGDWADDRLIPDFIRALSKGLVIKIRNPYAIRPWQYVLDLLSGYLILAERLYSHGPDYAEAWNFGPDDKEAKNVEWIADTFCRLWGNGASFIVEKASQPHEANYLKLDCSKANTSLDWYPRWNLERTINGIIEWYRAYLKGEDIEKLCNKQIHDFLNEIDV